MKPITNRVKQVERKPLTFWESIYLISIAKGLMITLKHFFSKKATISYPEKQRPFSPVFRGLHVLNRDEEDRENCTACGLCALACPAEAITMEAAERLPGEENLYREEKYAAKYEINMLRCIFCGFCEEACPVDAIVETHILEYHGEKRGDLYYTKPMLLAIGDRYESEIAKSKAADAPYR